MRIWPEIIHSRKLHSSSYIFRIR